MSRRLWECRGSRSIGTRSPTANFSNHPVRRLPDRSLWTEGDWQWKEKHGIEHPVFWTRRNRKFRYRAMFEEIPLPLDWPVYVSHAEACAYASWRGKRLPTEPEWHQTVGPTHFEMNRWDPVPVNASLGPNGWEWTSSPFEPFPGFKPFPFFPVTPRTSSMRATSF